MRSVPSFILYALLLFPVVVSGCKTESATSTHDHAELGETKVEEEFERGPHGGRLLTSGPLSLEVTIFEKNEPPKFHVYAFKEETPLNPASVVLHLTLTRIGHQVDTISFVPDQDYLKSAQIIYEPHSFESHIRAEFEGKTYEWDYSSYEGRTTLTPEVVTSQGIVVEEAESKLIEELLEVRGEIRAVSRGISHLSPRFSGILLEAKHHTGDFVKEGEILALIESNESLRPFQLRAPISGVIMEEHAVAGESIASSDTIYVIADLTQVWGDFRVYPNDLEKVKRGQKITVRVEGVSLPLHSSISYIAPYADERTRAVVVRAVISNTDGLLRPGLFAGATIIVDEKPVSVAVKKTALQTFRDWNVVFRNVGDTFEIAPVTLGRSDAIWVEIKEGLLPGMRYVSDNSFLLKADILKSGATHDH